MENQGIALVYVNQIFQCWRILQVASMVPGLLPAVAAGPRPSGGPPALQPGPRADRIDTSSFSHKKNLMPLQMSPSF